MNADLPLGKLPSAPVIPSHQPSKMTMPELEERERVVKEGKDTFVKVGLALLEIREGRGYKLRGYATFEEYIQNQFEFSRRHAYRLMDAAETAIDIKNVTKLVTIENEAQAREIKEIGKETFIEKAQAALATKDPKKIAKTFRDIVKEHREEKKDKPPDLTPRRTPLGDAAPDADVSADIDFVFDDMVNEQRRNAVLESKKAREYPVSCPCGCGVWSFKSPPPPSRFIPVGGKPR